MLTHTYPGCEIKKVSDRTRKMDDGREIAWRTLRVQIAGEPGSRFFTLDKSVVVPEVGTVCTLTVQDELVMDEDGSVRAGFVKFRPKLRVVAFQEELPLHLADAA
jgi:hypothetical protein